MQRLGIEKARAGLKLLHRTAPVLGNARSRSTCPDNRGSSPAAEANVGRAQMLVGRVGLEPTAKGL